MQITTAIFRLLIFPGLLFAVPVAWLFLYVERKTIARMQQRIGPPVLQPFYDFVKLLGKESPNNAGLQGLNDEGMAGAVGIGHVGGARLFQFFLQGRILRRLDSADHLAGTAFDVLYAGGFTSRSIYGKVGSMREASLSLSSNCCF